MVEEQAGRIQAVRAACGSAMVINARPIFTWPDTAKPAPASNADCLFVPGVRDAETIGRLVKAVSGPLNILAMPGAPSVAEMQEPGVARVSLGSGPSRVALGSLRRLVRDLKAHGSFEALRDEAIPDAEVQKLLEH